MPRQQITHVCMQPRATENARTHMQYVIKGDSGLQTDAKAGAVVFYLRSASSRPKRAASLGANASSLWVGAS